MAEEWFVYLLRCKGGAFYGGVTTDVRRRYKDHCGGSRGAKFTRSHPPEGIAAVWRTGDRSAALRIEYRLKHLSAAQKQLAAAAPDCLRTLIGLSGEEPCIPLTPDEYE